MQPSHHSLVVQLHHVASQVCWALCCLCGIQQHGEVLVDGAGGQACESNTQHTPATALSRLVQALLGAGTRVLTHSQTNKSMPAHVCMRGVKAASQPALVRSSPLSQEQKAGNVLCVGCRFPHLACSRCWTAVTCPAARLALGCTPVLQQAKNHGLMAGAVDENNAGTMLHASPSVCPPRCRGVQQQRCPGLLSALFMNPSQVTGWAPTASQPAVTLTVNIICTPHWPSSAQSLS